MVLSQTFRGVLSVSPETVGSGEELCMTHLAGSLRDTKKSPIKKLFRSLTSQCFKNKFDLCLLVNRLPLAHMQGLPLSSYIDGN